MLYYRTYLDKCATIVRGSKLNTGFNPVSELVYGRNLSRFLFHFDEKKIGVLVNDGVLPDISKLRHVLKIKNASSLDFSELHKVYGSQIDGGEKKRATSFDLIFFLIPELWDGGKGFDYTMNCFTMDYYDKAVFEIDKYISEDGVSWYQSVNGKPWADDIEYVRSVDGLVTFLVKSDKNIVSDSGDEVVFTYCCDCGSGLFANSGLVFKPTFGTLDNPLEVSDAIYFSNSGKVCRTQSDIEQYGKYAMVKVKTPSNDSGLFSKMSFVCEYTIDGGVYKSNPYTIVSKPHSETSMIPVKEDGIYSTETLEKQLELYDKGEESIVIGKQHFDVGCEDISVDITEAFNKFITGEYDNYGIGVAFSPKYEDMVGCNENYVGLLTNRTNSFFEPYVETVYLDSVKDDRQNFVLGRLNRLYLYANIGGDLVNLDQLPTCTVDGVEYEVKHGGKGIYYIEIKLPVNAFSAPTMLYDVWDDIVYHGETLSPVELEFTTKPASSYFQIGSSMPEKATFTPTVYGINDSEEIKRGDLRKVCFVFKKDYAKNTAMVIDDVDARLYVMDGTAEVDVIPYLETNRAFTDTYIIIDTSMLIPNTYYMDVRVKYGMEMIEHHDILHFTIVNEENNKYA